jgi:hypothetical protein
MRFSRAPERVVIACHINSAGRGRGPCRHATKAGGQKFTRNSLTHESCPLAAESRFARFFLVQNYAAFAKTSLPVLRFAIWRVRRCGLVAPAKDHFPLPSVTAVALTAPIRSVTPMTPGLASWSRHLLPWTGPVMRRIVFSNGCERMGRSSRGSAIMSCPSNMRCVIGLSHGTPLQSAATPD